MALVNISPTQTTPPVQPVKRGETKQPRLDDERGRREYAAELLFKDRGIASAEVSETQISEAVRRANKSLEWAKRHFEYSFHDKTNTFVVRVYDSESEELIREIPPERILDLVARLWEIAGLIVDERV
jgi:uncharacterized FlaG/YvyC family protein